MNVVDIKNNSYQVKEKIGQGSQGTTYLLEDKKHIVKLFNKRYADNTAKSKINFLINLGLDKRVFSVPLRQITQPNVGYISEFASGMMSLTAFMSKTSKGSFLDWYVSTGGLLKRYYLLIRLAEVLRTLHSKGLAYCDLSPNNVFVSKKPDSYNIFLIDLDNLRYKTSLLNNIYTPYYGAPEVVSNLAPNTVKSDCFSFAVLAYELLTSNHPLIGDYVSDGAPELEEEALAGKLPWVDHQKNRQNRRTTGIPSEKFMPEKLLSLFRRFFEEGLNDPLKRPSIAECLEVLNLSLNKLLQCPKCNLQYPYDQNKSCSFCEYQPSKVLRIQMRRWEEDVYYDNDSTKIKKRFLLQPEVFEEIIMDENTPKEITALSFLLTDIDPKVKILKLENILDKIRLIPLNEMKLKISPRTGSKEGEKAKEINKPINIKIVDPDQEDKVKCMLHLEELDKPQRVLTVD